MAKKKKKGKSALTPYQRKMKDLRTANKRVEDVKLEAAQNAIMILYIMLLYTMYFYYGWKQKRLERVLMQFRRIYEAVIKGERSLGQLADELKRDAGLDIDVKNGLAKVWEE